MRHYPNKGTADRNSDGKAGTIEKCSSRVGDCTGCSAWCIWIDKQCKTVDCVIYSLLKKPPCGKENKKEIVAKSIFSTSKSPALSHPHVPHLDALMLIMTSHTQRRTREEFILTPLVEPQQRDICEMSVLCGKAVEKRKEKP
jgi:hypothetical protein